MKFFLGITSQPKISKYVQKLYFFAYLLLNQKHEVNKIEGLIVYYRLTKICVIVSKHVYT
jgi:hypothetical protein